MLHRTLRIGVVLASAAATCLACGVGPSSRPGVAVVRHGGAQAPVPGPHAPAKLPAPGVPKNDLSWHDCTRRTMDTAAVGPAPAGLMFDCADYTVPVDAAGSIYGSTTVGVVRARSDRTPKNAAPWVFTSGSDRASSVTLAALAAGPSGALLAQHPIVAVDRRTIGQSTPIDCRTPGVRQGLADNAQGVAGDPIDAMASLSEQATTTCKDDLQPQELTLDAAHAADDIEQLRVQWQIDRIALIGSGNGAQVALSYAAKHPQRLARLLLDSPAAAGANATTLTEQRVQGAEATLTSFAQRCVSLNCALGPDPRTAIVDLEHRAADGKLAGVSGNGLLTAIIGFLGSPRADQLDRTRELADVLSAADHGDLGSLVALIQRENAGTRSDGQFLATCSDEQQRAPIAAAKQLRADWAQKYPIFGAQAAIGLIACTAWPSVDPAPLPRKLEAPVLILAAAADPVTGTAGLSSVTGALSTAGGNPVTVTWQGWGHPVLPHSTCAQQFALTYLTDGKLPKNGAACPA